MSEKQSTAVTAEARPDTGKMTALTASEHASAAMILRASPVDFKQDGVPAQERPTSIVEKTAAHHGTAQDVLSLKPADLSLPATPSGSPGTSGGANP